MKKFWLCLMVWGLSLLTMAEIKIPRVILEPTALEAARKEAQKERETIVYVMVNTAGTQAFVEEALDELNRLR